MLRALPGLSHRPCSVGASLLQSVLPHLIPWCLLGAFKKADSVVHLLPGKPSLMIIEDRLWMEPVLPHQPFQLCFFLGRQPSPGIVMLRGVYAIPESM